MNILKTKDLLERIHKLILLRATGNPQELSLRLDCSERKVYRLMNELKELGAPIKYDRGLQSYIYEEECEFNFDFIKKGAD